MKRTFNKTIRTFHIWAGLAIGALFCIMSLSGSVLTFRPAIEDLFRPAWQSKSTARPQNVLTEAGNNIARQWPDATIVSLSLSEQPGSPVEFGLRTGEGELRVFADARSGEVLGTFGLPWLEWLTELHHHILVESVGKKIVGFIGIFLVLSSLTGFLIWVRRANRWRLFGTRRGATRRFTMYDTHRAVGVIGNVMLFFVAVTGVVIAFPQTITQLLGGPAPRPVVITQTSAVHMTFEGYIAAAGRALPGGAVKQLRFPRTSDRPVTVRMRMPGDLRENGSTRVYLEPGTARVLSLDKPGDWPLSKSIVQTSTPLHYGEWGGMSVRILWALIGLLPPVLFVSGVMMWWAPYAAKRKAARIARTRSLVSEENLVA